MPEAEDLDTRSGGETMTRRGWRSPTEGGSEAAPKTERTSDDVHRDLLTIMVGGLKLGQVDLVVAGTVFGMVSEINPRLAEEVANKFKFEDLRDRDDAMAFSLARSNWQQKHGPLPQDSSLESAKPPVAVAPTPPPGEGK